MNSTLKHFKFFRAIFICFYVLNITLNKQQTIGYGNYPVKNSKKIQIIDF